jgi:DNA processing protein
LRGVGPVIADYLLHWEEHFNLDREEDRLAKAGAEFITARDPHYPTALREIHDPPIGPVPKG